MTATTRMPTQVPTLVVDVWQARCSACGGSAAFSRIHIGVGDGDGCGVSFEAVACAEDAQLGMDGTAQAIARALDLPHAPRQPMPVRRAAR